MTQRALVQAHDKAPPKATSAGLFLLCQRSGCARRRLGATWSGALAGRWPQNAGLGLGWRRLRREASDQKAGGRETEAETDHEGASEAVDIPLQQYIPEAPHHASRYRQQRVAPF